MNSLTQHYALLLGLDDHWQVEHVDLAAQRIEICLSHAVDKVPACPGCGCECPLKDHAPERRWRHLDTMQFETLLVAHGSGSSRVSSPGDCFSASGMPVPRVAGWARW